MTKRFTINDCRVLSDEQVLKILNQLVDENENTKSILDDFMWILNVLQANPNDTKRLGVARDMLQNMGVLLYDK